MKNAKEMMNKLTLSAYLKKESAKSKLATILTGNEGISMEPI